MNTSTKLQSQEEPITERIMSKADELELRRYFIKALVWVSGVAVSIVISIGGFLYKRMDDQVNEINLYRVEHQEENKRVMVEYSTRIAHLETDVEAIRNWQKDMQETLKESRSNQKEILDAIKSIKER